MEDLLQVLQIFLKYKPSGEYWYTGAEHDIIYFSGPDKDTITDPSDRKELEKLGVHWGEYDCWAMYT